MVILLGVACVAWTALELNRLMRAQPAFGPAARVSSHDSGTGPRRSPRVGRFAAWDDRGRPITVEDLGHR